MRICTRWVKCWECNIVSSSHVYLGSHSCCVYRIISILSCPRTNDTTKKKVIIGSFTKGMIPSSCCSNLIKYSRPMVICCCSTIPIGLIELRPGSVWRLYSITKRLIYDKGNQNITNRASWLCYGLAICSSISCECACCNKCYCHTFFRELGSSTAILIRRYNMRWFTWF